MVRGDKYKKRKPVLKYWAFKEECLLKRVKLYDAMTITFYMPMPKSWSRVKRAEMNGKPHQVRPDKDNLEKGLFDILKEDSHIWHTNSKKVWSYKAGIEIDEIS